MGKGLLGAFEDLSFEDPTPMDIETELLANEDLYKEIVEQEKTYDRMIEETSSLEESIERLTTLRNDILEHGICRSMMEEADPNGELVEKGFCCSYETLSDRLIVDQNAKIAVEGIGSALKSLWKMFRKPAQEAKLVGRAVGKAVGLGAVGVATGGIAAELIVDQIVWTAAEKVIKFFHKHVYNVIKKHARYYLSSKDTLCSIGKKLETAGKFDNVEFNQSTIKSYSKADFKRALNAGSLVIKTIESGAITKLTEEASNLLMKDTIDKNAITSLLSRSTTMLKPIASNSDVKNVLGITVDPNAPGNRANKSTTTIIPTMKTVEEQGFVASDVQIALKSAYNLADGGMKTVAHMEETSNACERMSQQLEAKAKKNKRISKDQSDLFRSASEIVRALTDANQSLIVMCMVANRKVGTSAVNLGRAALRAAKK